MKRKRRVKGHRQAGKKHNHAEEEDKMRYEDTAKTCLEKTLELLAKAHAEMQKLASCSDDWSACCILDTGFDDLEDACREFVHLQFGLECPKEF